MMVSTRLLRVRPRPVRGMQETLGVRRFAVIAAGSQLLRRPEEGHRRTARSRLTLWYDSLPHDDRSPATAYRFLHDADAFGTSRGARSACSAGAVAWLPHGCRRPRPTARL